MFKIFKLSPDQFEVVHNLRDLPHKHINLNYSSNDVQWNPRDGENSHVGIIIFWADHVYKPKANYKYLSLLWQCFSTCHKELPILVTILFMASSSSEMFSRMELSSFPDILHMCCTHCGVCVSLEDIMVWLNGGVGARYIRYTSKAVRWLASSRK